MREAPVKYPVHELIKKRWSPVAFADKGVEKEKLHSLLEAARWAPSSYNEQPWSYILATKENPEEFNRLLGCLVEANQEWAQHAPVLMISVARLAFEKNGKENRHAFHDIGLSSGNMVVEATALGLYVHQMAGIDVAKAQTTYGIPATHSPLTGIAIGYLGDASKLTEKLQQRNTTPSGRKEATDFVFQGGWGKAWK